MATGESTGGRSGIGHPDLELDGEGAELIFAMAHEIGNQIGAIRLQAHLLDDDLGPRELAAASVDLDDLAARASGLLALVRPVLSAASESPPDLAPLALLEGVREAAIEQGVRGVSVRVEVEVEGELAPIQAEADILRALLSALTLAATEAARPKGKVVLSVRAEDGEIAWTVADDGEEEELGEDATRCGRSLICALATHLLVRRGGRVETGRSSDWTRVSLILPIG